MSVSDAMLLRVLTACGRLTGQQFFEGVVQALSESCRVHGAFICELSLDTASAREVAGCIAGELVEPFEYSLAGTPCRDVLARGEAVYAGGVAGSFPDDAWLEDVQAESYVSLLLSAASGDPIGMLGIVHNRVLPDLGEVVRLLRALAPRVAVELERRQMETALRRSEARMRLLVEHSKDVMFYYKVDPVTGFDYVAPAVIEVLGLPPEALQANPDRVIELLHSDDRVKVIAAMASGSEEPITARLTRPDGEKRWIEYQNFALRDNETRLVAVGGSIRDITPRLKAQEDLILSRGYTRSLLETLPDTVIRVDAGGEVLDFVAGEDLGSLGGPDPVGHRLDDVLPPDVAGEATRLLRDVLATSEAQRSEIETGISGESRSFELRCSRFGEDEALLILRDFTAVKWRQAEEQNRRLRDDLDVKVEQRLRTEPYGLTYRELSILHLVAAGSADKQIAESLGISTHTVSKHVGNILAKMNAASRTEAGVRALREGLLR